MTGLNRSLFQAHPFHMVSPSSWPFISSWSLGYLAVVATFIIQSCIKMSHFFTASLVSIFGAVSYWFRDISIESSYQGNHTLAVQRGIFIGVGLFIVSEALFFFAIFWTYFHSSLSPTVELGSQWPPVGIQAIDPFEFPLLNTLILLSSGVSVTYGHHSIIHANRNNFLAGFGFTLVLAAFFTLLQKVEYSASNFTISDGVFGSCFFLGTGFHGFHVIIGTYFLLFTLVRGLLYHLTQTHHLGLESSIMYWHFVDIVWIFLYVAVYYWGS